MSVLTLAIIIVFIAGYVCIAIESVTHINKAAIALLMMVACWTLFMVNPGEFLPDYSGEALYDQVNHLLQLHLGDTATTLFFLMGAMTIVEVVDQNGGFNFVRNTLKTTHKRRLLWSIAFMTFFLSAILDNLTTSIVMIMVLHKLVDERADRLIYASVITAAGVIMEIIIPSLVSMVVPVFCLQYMLHGTLQQPELDRQDDDENELTGRERKAIFFLGVGGLIFVPIFKHLTHLPPYVGILMVLGLLWLTSEMFYAHLPRQKRGDHMQKRVSNLLSRIDMGTILFFLGILMAVACLEEVGVLTVMGQWLNNVSGGNHYLVTGAIGIISSIVDNVPLVAGCMGMYPLAPTGDMAVDGIFWQLLAYCAGVGGSMLIIGSAAGVVVMGLEKVTFGWYMRRITPIALIGYLAGMVCYWALRTFVF